MTTTAVFAEILVGGLQAVLAVAYALGIIVDRIADSLFKLLFGKTSDLSDLRLQVLVNEGLEGVRHAPPRHRLLAR